MTSWSQDSSFTAASGLSFIKKLHINKDITLVHLFLFTIFLTREKMLSLLR
jgi:hypothetical protein